MGNAFLEHHKKWATKTQKSSYGFPILKAKVGEIQFRVLDDKPTTYYVHFESMGKTPVICPEDGCKFCVRGDKRSVVHYINVVDREDNSVKVLTYSPAVSEEIATLIAEVSETTGSTEENHPKNYDIRLIREGTTRQDTRYTAVKVDDVSFTPSKYTPFDLKKHLVPMSPDKMDSKSKGTNSYGFGSKTPVKDYSAAREEYKPQMPEVKTVIDEDDKEVI